MEENGEINPETTKVTKSRNDENNKINLVVKYGAKTLVLNKKSKANAIELASGDELITTLKALKVAVANGELDEAIAEVSEATRLAFGN